MQEVFDKVAKAIIAQGQPSIDEDDNCVYRAPNGLKCAAGHLIPDDEYSPEMETVQASWVAGRPPEDAQGEAYDGPVSSTLAKIVDATSIIFVNRLQMAHDDAAIGGESFLAEYVDKMRSVAREFGLNTDVLNA